MVCHHFFRWAQRDLADEHSGTEWAQRSKAWEGARSNLSRYLPAIVGYVCGGGGWLGLGGVDGGRKKGEHGLGEGVV